MTWRALQWRRCDEIKSCPTAMVNPNVAVWLVMLVATGVLVVPFLESVGTKVGDFLFAMPTKFTITSGLYVIAWMMSVILGATRAHESPIWCMLDSAGIPAIAGISILGLKIGH
jgi:hypothetical protein